MSRRQNKNNIAVKPIMGTVTVDPKHMVNFWKHIYDPKQSTNAINRNGYLNLLTSHSNFKRIGNLYPHLVFELRQNPNVYFGFPNNMDDNTRRNLSKLLQQRHFLKSGGKLPNRNAPMGNKFNNNHRDQRNKILKQLNRKIAYKSFTPGSMTAQLHTDPNHITPSRSYGNEIRRESLIQKLAAARYASPPKNINELFKHFDTNLNSHLKQQLWDEYVHARHNKNKNVNVLASGPSQRIHYRGF
jgi:hypothetical protein